MTIAGIYLSPEGVVFGADSTASAFLPNNGGIHFFDFTQKVFEIGDESTLGLITWGMGGVESTSHRTLIAQLGDDLEVKPAQSVKEVADRWTDRFWNAYTAMQAYKDCVALAAKPAHDPTLPVPPVGMRTAVEEGQLQGLRNHLGVGFGIGGYVDGNRTPEAFVIWFHPDQPKPSPTPLPQHTLGWWGVPNFFSRLLKGADDNLIEALAKSGKWTGTRAELDQLVADVTILPPGQLPIRDAVDYVYTCIVCTIKALKFSALPQLCGGPIEIAVVTTDRRFRWVNHKPWDAAIKDGALL